ncbi:CaiB/BaiF CoA transferase family protein [Neobacillus sp. NRS-1170]|uniref:CaiB/BaiF CoA transferase family protein n=1 Tax=Neobacillus sp. NRS-1170 TaxID=3233898 RepID=UPI003D2DB6B9
MSGPLSGIRVLDLTSVLMGPYCTMLLGDLGAEVIKVETHQGDNSRYSGMERNPGMGGSFLYINRSKKSIVLDLKTKTGSDALLKLAQKADVFLHTMRPDAIEKLGLSYDAVKQSNPEIIYCGAYGFSKDGPYHTKPAYDDIIQAASGLVAAQTALSGQPQYMATVLADKSAGLMVFGAILSALYYRERTGEGQNIEVPMFETMVSYTMVEHMRGMTFDPPVGPALYNRVISKNRKPYRTLDGYISVIVYNDKQWRAFFNLVGQPELIQDERFKDFGARMNYIDQLYGMVEEMMATKSTTEWLELLEKADIAAMPVYQPEDLLNDPHLKEIGFFKKVTHPTEGNMFEVGIPVRFSNSPAKVARHAPRLGENSVEILTELGYSPQDIKQMLAQGVTLDGTMINANT